MTSAHQLVPGGFPAVVSSAARSAAGFGRDDDLGTRAGLVGSLGCSRLSSID
jgi:hypothetical protein